MSVRLLLVVSASSFTIAACLLARCQISHVMTNVATTLSSTAHIYPACLLHTAVERDKCVEIMQLL